VVSALRNLLTSFLRTLDDKQDGSQPAEGGSASSAVVRKKRLQFLIGPDGALVLSCRSSCRLAYPALPCMHAEAGAWCSSAGPPDMCADRSDPTRRLSQQVHRQRQDFFLRLGLAQARPRCGCL
jgi:hypothetical protein